MTVPDLFSLWFPFSPLPRLAFFSFSVRRPLESPPSLRVDRSVLPPYFPSSFSLPSRLHVIPQLIPDIPALFALQTTQERGDQFKYISSQKSDPRNSTCLFDPAVLSVAWLSTGTFTTCFCLFALWGEHLFSFINQCLSSCYQTFCIGVRLVSCSRSTVVCRLHCL